MLLTALALVACCVVFFYLYKQLLSKIDTIQRQIEATQRATVQLINQMHDLTNKPSERVEKKLEVKDRKLPGANRRKRTPEEKERARQQAKERWAKKKAAQLVQPSEINHASIATVSKVS